MDGPPRDAGTAVLAAAYAVLFVLGAVLAVYGAFLVPLRLFGSVEGLADVIGLAGPLLVGYFAAVALGAAPAAVVPGVGWIVAVLVLNYGPGGDVVIPGTLDKDHGVAVVGTIYLASGLVGILGAGVLAGRRLRRVSAAQAFTPGGSPPRP